MKALDDQSTEHKSGISTHETTLSQSGEGGMACFEDHRPETAQFQQLQGMANRFSSGKHLPIQKKKNDTGLPDNLKSGIENLSGISMDDVKVHRHSNKPAQLNAHAYAQGTDIHLGSGQEKHLPHEAWHVVQQKQGRVKPTMQMKGPSTALRAGVNVNDDKGLEKEADVMGARATMFSVEQHSGLFGGHEHSMNNSTGTVQRNLEVQTEINVADDDFQFNNQPVGQTTVKPKSLLFTKPYNWDPAPKKLEKSLNTVLPPNTKETKVVGGVITDKKEQKVKVWVNSEDLIGAEPHLMISKDSGIWVRNDDSGKEPFLKKPVKARPKADMVIKDTNIKKSHLWRAMVTYNDKDYWVLNADFAGIKTASISDFEANDAWQPTVADVKQGHIGDCYLLAALLAIVNHDPQKIKHLFTELDGDRIGVKIFFNSGWRQINLEKTKFVKTNTGEDRFALASAWVQLIEKAYAYVVGKLGQSKDKADLSVLETQLGRQALESLTGVKAYTKKASGSKINVIKELKKSGVVIAGSKNFIEGKRNGAGHSAQEDKVEGLVEKHSYAVLGVYFAQDVSKGKAKAAQGYYPQDVDGTIGKVPDDNKDCILLRNPWGFYGREYDDEGKKSENASEDAATFWLTFSEFKQDFKDISYLSKPL